MFEKNCCACGTTFTAKRWRVYRCDSCRKAWQNENHKNRPKEQLANKAEKAKIRRRNHAQRVWDFLKEHPCVKCGESDPVVLEFDHIDETQKRLEISNMLYHSWEELEKELAKCRVMCCNCHRRRTSIQLGWYADIKK